MNIHTVNFYRQNPRVIYFVYNASSNKALPLHWISFRGKVMKRALPLHKGCIIASGVAMAAYTKRLINNKQLKFIKVDLGVMSVEKRRILLTEAENGTTITLSNFLEFIQGTTVVDQPSGKGRKGGDITPPEPPVTDPDPEGDGPNEEENDDDTGFEVRSQ